MGRNGNCGGCNCGSKYNDYYGGFDCSYYSYCRYPRRWRYGIDGNGRNDIFYEKNSTRNFNTPSNYLANQNKFNYSRFRGYRNLPTISDSPTFSS